MARVPFEQPSEKVWQKFFQAQSVQYGRGVGIGGFRGKQFQRGHGLGSVLGSLFKAILPVAKKVGKTVGKEALRTTAHVAADALSGEDVGESFQRRGKASAAKLLSKGVRKIEGGAPPPPPSRRRRVSSKKKKGQKGRGLGFMPKRIKKGSKRSKLIRRKVKVKDQLGSYLA